MGMASKNKNMGTDLGKEDLEDQHTWVYKQKFSMLSSKNLKAVLIPSPCDVFPKGCPLPQSLLAGPMILTSGCTLESLDGARG